MRRYTAAVKAFRARYPWVREFSTWNEANLGSKQPTGRHPRRTAVFYRALKKHCRDCKIVAVELLVTSNWRMYRWIHAFRKRAGGGRLIFGLHNYPDVTRLVGKRTRNFLRRVRNAEIWITETGGIVRHRHFKYDESRADKVVRHVFKLVAALPRVKRLYLYNWQYDGNVRWDSGLIGQDGTERKAYFALLDGLALDRFKPLPTPIDDPVVPPAPDGLRSPGRRPSPSDAPRAPCAWRSTQRRPCRRGRPGRGVRRSASSAWSPQTTCIEGRARFARAGTSSSNRAPHSRHSNS